MADFPLQTSAPHEKLHEECGIFGIWTHPDDEIDPVYRTHTALYNLQHRGQEACGIAVNDRGVISVRKGVGLISDVFTERDLRAMHGQAAIGHVRYTTSATNCEANAQPLVISHMKGNLALAHNGQIANAADLRDMLERNGSIFHTTNDSEIIPYLIVQERLHAPDIETAVARAIAYLRGAYSLVIMSPRKMIAVRDPNGFRPLCVGKLGKSFVFASESCALDSVGAEFLRDLHPGELAVVEDGVLRFLDSGLRAERSSLCVFEFVYFARPDSVIDGLSVDLARQRMGEYLADEHPVDADIVIGVPDSGISAAIGYAARSGIPYGIGLVKNRYIGRTFIQPTQGARENAVRLKLNPLASTVSGKRVVMVDDSIVRGTTSAHIVSLLREAGAKEVHMRLSSPPFVAPCYYGTDVPDQKMLIAAQHSVAEIREMIGVDSLGYLSEAALAELAKSCRLNFCTACFNGKYPVPPSPRQEHSIYERRISDND